MLFESRHHDERCACWVCDSAKWFFWPEPEPKRVLVSTNETAEYLQQLGWSRRRVAKEFGLSTSTAHKLVPPGRTVLRETANEALALKL